MNYPRGIIKKEKNYINYSNRGMSLEEDLNITNEQYRLSKKAVVYKKPTPITICQVNYNNKVPIITKAKFKTPSTTDYNGVYKGLYIDFEAKETKLKKFPLSNIHKHQLKHLHDITTNGGFSFIIVKFSLINKIYLLDELNLDNYIKNIKKSFIPLDYFINNGHEINIGFNPRIDYLKIVDIYKGETNEKKI